MSAVAESLLEATWQKIDDKKFILWFFVGDKVFCGLKRLKIIQTTF
jgi:hypothetical protein